MRFYLSYLVFYRKCLFLLLYFSIFYSSYTQENSELNREDLNNDKIEETLRVYSFKDLLKNNVDKKKSDSQDIILDENKDIVSESVTNVIPGSLDNTVGELGINIPIEEGDEDQEINDTVINEEDNNFTYEEKSKNFLENYDEDKKETEEEEIGKLLVPKYRYMSRFTSLSAPLESNSNSRMFVFSIPAPRGQITDRYGRTFAQNKISYYAGLKFPNESMSDDEVISFAKKNISTVSNLLGKVYDIEIDNILDHYKNRRWVLMILPGIINLKDAEKISKLESESIKLHPIYLRTYPKKNLASHIIGYVGKKSGFPKGQIESNEPLWEMTLGRDGIEKSMNKYLSGTPGKLQMIYNDKSKELKSFISQKAKPGKNVVLSLDLDMQEIAEKILNRKKVKSAFVLMDVNTGEILVMASWPNYNPNEFVPFINEKRSQELFNDPDKSMFPRAFRGEYPPASTFKIITALACLESGKISEYDELGCPGYRIYGGNKFRNWHKKSEGFMTVSSAIIRSCNTWFYDAAIKIGASWVVNVAHSFGLGYKTGIPILSEASGFMPSNSYYERKFGHRIVGGNLANISIGQGEVTASPLQVARMMAGVANEKYLPPAVLVKQIQDNDNNVVKQYDNEPSISLRLNKFNLNVVKKGMYGVVNSKFGTGKRAYNKYGTTAGKTGTGQWKVNIKQNVAWFAGFIPYRNPEYSYAFLYEGRPGEKVSGGKKAAPVVSEFFNKLASLRYKRNQELEKYKKDINYKPIIVEEENIDNKTEETEKVAMNQDSSDIKETKKINKKVSERKKGYKNNIAKKKPKKKVKKIKRKGFFGKLKELLGN